MSRVRAYLSECLLWAVRRTQLEIPIPHRSRSAFAARFHLTPLVRNTVLGALAEPPSQGAFLQH